MGQYDYVNQSLKKLCDECPNLNTDNCIKSQCLVGAAEGLFRVAEESGTRLIKGGDALIPLFDVQNYREERVADSVAEVCKLCGDCREHHNEECVVSLARRALEIAVLPENVPYRGSVLMYIMDVAQQNPAFAELIKIKYMEKKGITSQR